ncbi:MAG: septum formation initiator family protein [Proteobacteria bacterium]|nr:septum formation initiator family protein [Pseudomonadota bacterium]
MEQSQKGLKRTLGPVLAFIITLYFAYHIFQGERGFISWIKLSKTVKQDELTLSDLNKQKEALERRVSLLKPESLDLDMLEELARKLLNYKKQDETVIYTPEKQKTILNKKDKGTPS